MTWTGAASGLRASAAGIDVAAGNAARAADPSARARRLVLEPVPGGGVRVAGIQRMGDAVTDTRWRAALARAGYEESLAAFWERVSALVSEPGDGGIGAALGEWWSAWRALADDPTNLAARRAVIGAAQVLARRFHDLDGMLAAESRMSQEAFSDLSRRAVELLEQVARLNGLIARSSGGQPDLEDARDRALEELARIAGAEVLARADGQVQVQVGGMPVLVGDRVLPVEARPDRLSWRVAGVEVLPGGELGGHAAASRAAGELRARLGRVAWALASAVNQLHAQGTDLYGQSGLPVFLRRGYGDIGQEPDGMTASELEVNPAWASDERRVASAGPGEDPQGGTAVAEAMAELGSASGAPEGFIFHPDPWSVVGPGLDAAYESWVSLVGSEARAAVARRDAAVAVRDQTRREWLAAAGVSSDEAMVDLERYKSAYAAAARALAVTLQLPGIFLEEVR